MTPDGQFWWNWWIQFGVATGTFAVALVALFGEALRSKLFPPLLSLQLLRPEGERTRIKITTPPAEGSTHRKEDARVYHVHVVNERRWSPAHQVQVFLMRLEEPGPDGELAVTWVGDLPIRWRNQEVFPLARTIGPSADCDLCTVIKDKCVEIHPLVVPFNLEIRRSGKVVMVASLQARGNQANSEVLRVHISWDGGWEAGDQEMKRHLVVKALSETSV